MAKNKSQYDSTLNLPKTLFETRHDVVHEFHEVFASVSHDGCRHCLVCFFGDLYGSGYEQFV